jgi:tRNA G18 (ribose-2'-O)-methylase SpoU
LPEISALPVYGAFIDAPDIYSEPLEECGLIVLGNESRGISKETESFITKKISIPSPRHGHPLIPPNLLILPKRVAGSA